MEIILHVSRMPEKQVTSQRSFNKDIGRSCGMVVVGWLGRASTTLHYTHHVSHAGSRDTAVSFLFFLPFVLFFFGYGRFVDFLGDNLPTRTVKLRLKSP